MSEEISASDLIHDYISNYGKYVIREMFPTYIDGLKSVIRRSLWQLRDVHTNFIASQDALGRIFKIHPHSPDSLYKALIRLTQSFSTLHPLFILRGDEGNYSGDKYANYRYTAIKLSEFAHDVFFKNIDTNGFVYTTGDDLFTMEPKYLIPKIPVSLVLYSYCVGFGFTSAIPSYTLSDIANLVHTYAGYIDNRIDKDEFTSMSDKLLPVFPIHNNLINKKTFMLEGTLEIINPYTFFIKTIPFGNDMVTVKKRLFNMMKLGLIEEYKVASNTKEEANILVVMKNNKNIHETFFSVLKTIGFTNKFNPVFNFNKDDYTINLNKFNLIDSWFKERRRLLVSQINNKIITTKHTLRRLYCYLLISDDVDDVIDIIKKNNKRMAMRIISKKYSITLRQSDIILNTPLKTLSKNSKEEIKELYDKATKKKDELRSSLTSIDNIIVEDVDRIADKYKRTNFISKVPKYKGYISVDNTFLIQYENDEELEKLLHIYKNKYVNIFNHRTKPKCLLSFPNKIVPIESNKKYRDGYRYSDILNTRIYNVSRNKYVTSKLSITNINQLINPRLPVLYVDDKFIIRIGKVKDIKSDILYIKNLNNIYDRHVIAYFYINQKNKMRFQHFRVSTLPTKILSRTSKKNVKILDVFGINDESKFKYLNVPFLYSEYFKHSYYKISSFDKIAKEPFMEKRITSNIKI